MTDKTPASTIDFYIACHKHFGMEDDHVIDTAMQDGSGELFNLTFGDLQTVTKRAAGSHIVLEGSQTVVESLKALNNVAVTISFDDEGCMYLYSIGEQKWLVAMEDRPGKWANGVGQILKMNGLGKD